MQYDSDNENKQTFQLTGKDFETKTIITNIFLNNSINKINKLKGVYNFEIINFNSSFAKDLRWLFNFDNKKTKKIKYIFLYNKFVTEGNYEKKFGLKFSKNDYNIKNDNTLFITDITGSNLIFSQGRNQFNEENEEFGMYKKLIKIFLLLLLGSDWICIFRC